MRESIRTGDPPNAILLDEGERHFGVMVGRTDAINTGNRSDDDGIRTSEEGDGRSVAQAVDLVINGGIFFDVGVGRSDVGFGLVIVEVADEIVDLVFREELAELGIELSGKGFIVGENEGGALVILDDVRHGEGLAGAGDAQESLFADAGVETSGELGDGLRLIASRLVFGD